MFPWLMLQSHRKQKTLLDCLVIKLAHLTHGGGPHHIENSPLISSANTHTQKGRSVVLNTTDLKHEST